MVEGRLLAPPAAGVRVVVPRPLAPAEHPPTHDRRAGAPERLVDRLRGEGLLPARKPVRVTPASQRNGPVVEALAALAERLVERLVRAGDVAVERHRDV